MILLTSSHLPRSGSLYETFRFLRFERLSKLSSEPKIQNSQKYILFYTKNLWKRKEKLYYLLEEDWLLDTAEYELQPI